MSDTYLGDSSGKRVARFLVWDHVLKFAEVRDSVLGRRNRPWAERVLFFASRFGHDVPVLDALGEYRPNLLAVESNRRAAREFAARYPDVDLRRCDVGRLTPDALADVRAACLDFCGPACSSVMSTIGYVWRHLPEGAVLIVGLMRARESGLGVVFDSEAATDAYVATDTARFRKMMEESAARIRASGREPKLSTKERERAVRINAAQTRAHFVDTTRADYVQKVLNETGGDGYADRVACVNYVSDTPHTLFAFQKVELGFGDRSPLLHKNIPSDVVAEALSRELVTEAPKRQWEDLLVLPKSTITFWRRA